jgi:hypothetical protein
VRVIARRVIAVIGFVIGVLWVKDAFACSLWSVRGGARQKGAVIGAVIAHWASPASSNW